MLLIIILLILLFLLFLVFFLLKRLLQYYDLVQEILYTLELYSKSLNDMTTGYLSTDHPEVLMFHNENMKHYKQILNIINSVSFLKKKTIEQKLPLPDVE